ncbi:hypothetical protein Tco_0995833, partial [Tanacetum coccineum]
MVDVAQNTNNTTIKSILLSEKLTGSSFTNWYRNLRIVLKYEKKMKFVEQYGYTKNHKKTVKNGQARTRERKSEQKPEE